MSTDFLEHPLDAASVRVLGALAEKAATTPDNYPLTLSSLMAACNQTSNRDPVLELDEPTVLNSVGELRRRSLVSEVYRSDSRARRYRHLLADSLHLHSAEIAVLGVLMLRGAQTAGEIRTRTARLHQFEDLPRLELTLNALMTLPQPLLVQLPRQPGQKEVRYAHLLAGEPQAEAAEQPEPEVSPEPGRVAALEQDVASLRAELAELRARLDEFQRQFV